MRMIRTVFCTLLLVVGAYAIQSRPPQMQPAPGTAPGNGSQNPQPQPPDTQAPQAQPPEQSPQAQPPQNAKADPPSIDDQVATLTQELSLSSDQAGKVKNILVDQRQQAMGVVGDQGLSRADKIQKIHAIREATISRVRDSLNEDQKKKLDQMLQAPPEQAPPNKEPQGNPPPK
jgi:hypothetical protein